MNHLEIVRSVDSTHDRYETEVVTENWNARVRKRCVYACIGILVAVTIITVFVPFGRIGVKGSIDVEIECIPQSCAVQLVESIPEGLVYNSTVQSLPTFEAWDILLKKLTTKLELASSYWSLRGSDVYEHPSDYQGEEIYDQLVKAAKRGISIDIAQNKPSNSQPNRDTIDLAKLHGIRVKSLDFPHLMGNGILHTKLWIVDRRHFYVGSANFDWRSLTQVKEMGVLVLDCPCLAEDMGKIFDVYWMLGGQNKTIPASWPPSLRTQINPDQPLNIDNTEDGSELATYLSSSPPPFCPDGRVSDIDAISDVIAQAEKFIYIAVMDYFPQTIYTEHAKFWPVIDDALRKGSVISIDFWVRPRDSAHHTSCLGRGGRSLFAQPKSRLKQTAIERGVTVRLLLSQWDHTRPSMKSFLKSLTDLGMQENVKIEGKMFQVPSFTPDQAKIPFARVNHNKYMVTEKHGFIGTSNWSADYFINTGGIGFVFKPVNGSGLRQQLENVFLRDWESSYSFVPR